MTVDIDPSMRPTVTADLRYFHYHGPSCDLVWASPPCTEFARWSLPWITKKAIPDMSLVNASVRVAKEARARWWIIENVKGAQCWLGRAVVIRNPIYLWGRIPASFSPPAVMPWKSDIPPGPTRVFERARLPILFMMHLAIAIEAATDRTPAIGE